MQRKCDICGDDFEAKRKDARTCSSTCRNNRARGAAKKPLRGEDSLVGATRRELEEAGKADTVLGQLALSLAGRMSGTVTGLAALSKEFRAVKAEALGASSAGSSSTPSTDGVDELRARRDAKRAG